MNKSFEATINKAEEPVITVKKSTLKRVLTIAVSLPVGITIFLFLNAINTISCAFNYYCGRWIFDAPHITVPGDLIVIIAVCALILCIYGIISSVLRKYSRLMFTVISAAVCILTAVTFYLKLVTIYYPQREVGPSLYAVEIAIHIVYALIVFLISEFAGFPLMNKLKT